MSVKTYILSLAVLAVLSVQGCSSQSQPSPSPSTAPSSAAAPSTATVEETTAEVREALPFFQYNKIYECNGYDPAEAAVYEYLAFERPEGYDPYRVLIPYVNIVAIDDSDQESSLIYGDYYLYEFEKHEDTLVMTSGSHCPGVIHAMRDGEGGKRHIHCSFHGRSLY